jgi:hypothetical protein
MPAASSGAGQPIVGGFGGRRTNFDYIKSLVLDPVISKHARVA